jgi:hypothetical protein
LIKDRSAVSKKQRADGPPPLALERSDIKRREIRLAETGREHSDRLALATVTQLT